MSNSAEMQLGPAAVKHETELPTIFDSPVTAHAEAEALLSSLGQLPGLSRSRHLRDLVLSSHDGIVIAHCIDQSGFQRTDLMLLNMGLITPSIPWARGNFSDLDIQYGMAIVHFYPNLGGEAPPGWQIPYISPPVAVASVSSHVPGADKDSDWKFPKVEPDSAVRASSPPTRGGANVLAHHLFPDDNNTRDEVCLPCASCLAAHASTCSATSMV